VKIAVVVPRPKSYTHSAALLDLAVPLAEGLKEHGFDAEITSQPSRDRSVIVGPHLLSQMPPENAILYNTEQISAESPWFSGPLLDLYRQHRVWDYDPMNTTALKALGVNAVTVPPGYAPCLTCVERKADPDIDVLFFGSVNVRRATVLNELGRNFKIAYASDLYGSDRDRMVARAKIVLNVHYYQAAIFEAARVSYLLANRAFVVSEKSTHMPWRVGYVAMPYDKLIDTCADYLTTPEERARIAELGFETFSGSSAAEMVRPVVDELGTC